MNDFTFPKSRRLLRPAEFDRVFRRRQSQSDGIIIAYGCENGLPHPRLGLVVSRKAGGAVVRNRWKRCLREAFRLSQHALPPNLDLVVLPRPGATPTMPRLQRSLGELARRLARQLGLPATATGAEPPDPTGASQSPTAVRMSPAEEPPL